MRRDNSDVPAFLKEAIEEATAAGLFNSVQHQKKRAYLLAFSICGNVTLAAKAAGVDRSMIYKWRNGVAGRPNDHGDEGFRAAETIAKEMASDRLEEEAWRRAVDGIDEPVGFYRGEPGAWVKRYSDTLLIFLLKGLRPEKYRERFEHSGSDRPIPVMVVRRETAREKTN